MVAGRPAMGRHGPRYHADDDDAYDIVHSDILGFGDTPLELIVDNATASDCLRALHEYVILLVLRIHFEY